MSQITSQQRLNIGLKRSVVTLSQIDVLPSLRIATTVSGKAGQNYFFQNRAKSLVNQTKLEKTYMTSFRIST